MGCRYNSNSLLKKKSLLLDNFSSALNCSIWLKWCSSENQYTMTFLEGFVLFYGGEMIYFPKDLSNFWNTLVVLSYFQISKTDLVFRPKVNIFFIWSCCHLYDVVVIIIYYCRDLATMNRSIEIKFLPMKANSHEIWFEERSVLTISARNVRGSNSSDRTSSSIV